MQLPDSRISVN